MTRVPVAVRPVRLLLFVLMVLMAAACSHSPVAPTAGDSVPSDGADRTAQRLPWQIQATVATTPAPPPAGCLAYLSSEIEGTATYLGRFTGVGSTCITDQVAPDPDPPFVPAGPPPYATAHFTNPLWTLTAANGDELWLENTDATAVISAVDGSLLAFAEMRILGGTGRFEGATGEADVSGVNADGIGPDDFSGRGWIRFQ